MKRAGHHFAPEVTSHDLESPNGGKTFGGGEKMIGLNGAPLNIQSFQGSADSSKSRRGKSPFNSEGTQKIAMIAGGIWLLGIFMGYEWTWPLGLVLDILYTILNIPPFSWLFGWIWTPLQWIFGWFYKGAPLVDQVGALQELRLPNDQVPTYLDSYVQQYGDAALIFASHDGYPQIVNGLLYNKELGYRDLVDATDENGNTALIYASAKGYRQTTAALLRHGADPDIANQGGGGRTPLMEAAGGGHKDIVSAIRLTNATIDMVDDFQNTALHYAAYHGHLSVVHELLKGNPRRDIKNSYGHTAASYALSNKHKAIADLLNRSPTKKEQERAEKLAQQEQEKAEFMKDPDGAMKALAKELGLGDVFGGDKKKKEEKHVKGGAEELHKADDFAPKLESSDHHRGMTDAERKAMEDQIAKLKHAHDEAELKAQKRIVELLEKNSGHQKALDDKDRESRELKLNHTELQMKVQELEMQHRSSESRATEEKERADRLHEEKQTLQLEMDRHRSRAEGAERERDMHMEAARRHEETIKRTQQEVNDHMTRIERHQREMQQLREELRQKEDEVRRHKETLARLEGGTGGSSYSASAAAPTPPSPPPPPAVSPAVEQPHEERSAGAMDASGASAPAAGSSSSNAASEAPPATPASAEAGSGSADAASATAGSHEGEQKAA
mmetsp:Transcript_130608/g.325902  ORF Transcript_130608/g.325902 Transcript_130608/m.325902 type:complete len:672 (-) Transcript_130608:151-2166(-)